MLSEKDPSWCFWLSKGGLWFMNRLCDSVTFFFPFVFFVVSAFFCTVSNTDHFSLFTIYSCRTCFLLLGSEAGLCQLSDHNASICFLHSYSCTLIFLKLYFWRASFRRKKEKGKNKKASVKFSSCLESVSPKLLLQCFSVGLLVPGLSSEGS